MSRAAEPRCSSRARSDRAARRASAGESRAGDPYGERRVRHAALGDIRAARRLRESRSAVGARTGERTGVARARHAERQIHAYAGPHCVTTFPVTGAMATPTATSTSFVHSATRCRGNTTRTGVATRPATGSILAFSRSRRAPGPIMDTLPAWIAATSARTRSAGANPSRCSAKYSIRNAHSPTPRARACRPRS